MTVNLVEGYIVEIHNEDPFSIPWDTEDLWMKVDVTVDSYGQVTRQTYYLPRHEWVQIKEQGFFMI